jgi:hypothetical protein
MHGSAGLNASRPGPPGQADAPRDRQEWTELALLVYCAGPWERIGHWLWGITPAGGIWREIRPGSLRHALGWWCLQRDESWRRRRARGINRRA